MNRKALATVVLSKPPLPGECKNRLAREIGDSAAARLMRAMLLDTIEQLNYIPADERILLTTNRIHSTDVAELIRKHGWKIQTQEYSSFSDVIRHAVFHAPSSSKCILFHVADAPFINLLTLRGFISEIQSSHNSVAFAVSGDGGFNAAVLNRTIPKELFDGVNWSGPSVYYQLKAICQKHRLKVIECAGGLDIDDIRSLELATKFCRKEESKVPFRTCIEIAQMEL